MRAVLVLPPGRLPTVVHDPGRWWDRLGQFGVERVYCNANYLWWDSLAGAALRSDIVSGANRTPDGALDRLAESAGCAFRALREPQTYESFGAYRSAVAALVSFIDALNGHQSEFAVSLPSGPTVAAVDYHDSLSLLAFSQRDSLLARSIDRVLADVAEGDFVGFKVTSPQDLLTAMIAARLLRGRKPGIHCCLVDHGYENFSLHAHIDRLEAIGALEQAFDTIVRRKEDASDTVVGLCSALSVGKPLRGFLGTRDVEAVFAGRSAGGEPMPPAASCAAEPVYWTRLSERRCYWARCTYCVQNEKYSDSRAPSKLELRATMDRIEGLLRTGYRNFIFSDEAVSPAMLNLFADEILQRGLHFGWACRCKLENAFTPDLLCKLAKAGCYEILFGMESTSADTLKRMDKHVTGLDEDAIRRIFGHMHDQGIGIHLNLIGAFPLESMDEVRATVDFTIAVLSRMRNATFILNEFELFPGTPMAVHPERHAIARVSSRGDMPQVLGFQLVGQSAELRRLALDSLPLLRQRLYRELGWGAPHEDPATAAALDLYFASGHGATFKSMPTNPLDPVQAVRASRIVPDHDAARGAGA